MGFHDDLVQLARDPEIRGWATKRAGSRELAEDALQETYWNVVRKDPEAIDDLRRYFFRALAHEISHLRTRPGAIPVEDVAAADEQRAASSRGSPPDSVAHEAEVRRLAQSVLNRLDIDREQLMAAVPGRSPNQRRYRSGIVVAARTIFLLLLQGTVARLDENEVLRSTYHPWFADPSLTADVKDQRLSRGRRDVRVVLQRLVSRDEFGF
jgi:DNA-directed RNA polymerase specialized sigma24 family protein